MPSTDRKLELKAKTSVSQTASQASVYAKELNFTAIISLIQGDSLARGPKLLSIEIMLLR
jgi:hypothetical protein